jgi:hypothetical protein
MRCVPHTTPHRRSHARATIRCRSLHAHTHLHAAAIAACPAASPRARCAIGGCRWPSRGPVRTHACASRIARHCARDVRQHTQARDIGHTHMHTRHAQNSDSNLHRMAASQMRHTNCTSCLTASLCTRKNTSDSSPSHQTSHHPPPATHQSATRSRHALSRSLQRRTPLSARLVVLDRFGERAADLCVVAVATRVVHRHHTQWSQTFSTHAHNTHVPV